MFSFGIGTKNIVITDGKAQQTRTGQTAEQTAQSLYTDIRTETAEEQSGRLQNVFDKEAVQKELDVQREVSQQFSKNVQEAKAEINRKLDALEEQKKAGIISQSEYEKERKNWDNLHLGLSIVSGALLAPTDSALGIVAAAASPKVTQEIGQHFKHNAELNKLDGGNRPEEGSKEHIALHTLNGILTGAAGGNNALLTGLAAGGAELVAPTLSKTLYGKESKDLTADEKATVSALSNVFGSAVGAASGAGNAVAGAQVAQGAVENNAVRKPLGENYLKRFKAAIAAKSKLEKEKVYQEVMKEQMDSSKAIKEACKVNRSACENFKQQLLEANQYYRTQLSKVADKETKNLLETMLAFNNADLEVIQHGLSQKPISNRPSSQNPPPFSGISERILPNGRKTKGVASTGDREMGLGRKGQAPDYVAIGTNVGDVIIPTADPTNIMLSYTLDSSNLGKALSKNAPSATIRAGWYLDYTDSELVAKMANMDIYDKSPSFWPQNEAMKDRRKKYVNNALQGNSIITGGCVYYGCIYKATSLDGKHTSYEVGVGFGSKGSSINIGISDTQSIKKEIK